MENINNENINDYELKLTMDFVFKRIFGHENTKDILLSLLNAILNGKPYIKDLTLLNTVLENQEIRAN